MVSRREVMDVTSANATANQVSRKSRFLFNLLNYIKSRQRVALTRVSATIARALFDYGELG